ncbi:Quinone oxidoreductase 1 [Pseudobythopirellula maris]|uniref:Quinone oxidoreductase 1 n=1 Tax=Pseudobythopirellula maris TaxID=2527991 RepID=A0A5C5ZU25_9BACT|nr:NAD(P)-dependent alcohol dehydrogenase [Pseudobythopirellula maris]TWT90518.1 Quinone oxidoreductase 1 [Pseudobythopirellula maris]
MRAAVYTEYGPPEVVRVIDVNKPTVGKGEMLVRVHATTVNSADWRFRAANPWLIRLFNGLLSPKNQVLGVELAGVVEEVGEPTNGSPPRFKPGDWVFGEVANHGMGAHAEYKRLSQDAPLVATPAGLDHHEAVATPFGALAAIVFLRDKAKLQPGERVLVNGASGAVGVFCVQIAKLLGAEVTAVTSTKNLELVRSLGADHAVDYTQGPALADGERYDLIIDTVGLLDTGHCLAALTPKGRFLPVAFGPSHMLRSIFNRLTGGRPVLCNVAEATLENTEQLAAWLAEGKLRPVIDHRAPLDDISEAHRYAEAGHKVGAVVIDVA